MTDQTNMRLPERTRNQIADLRAQCGMNITDTTIKAIDELWRAEFHFTFNHALTELGISDDGSFHAYWASKRARIDETHPLNVWEAIYRCYEAQRDYDDELDTQRCAQQ